MRVWDAGSGSYIDVQASNFTGPHATETLIDGAAYIIRGHYLTDAAPARGGSQQAKYRRKERRDAASAGPVERRKQPREGKAA